VFVKSSIGECTDYNARHASFFVYEGFFRYFCFTYIHIILIEKMGKQAVIHVEYCGA
jgi:hypothetical protein